MDADDWVEEDFYESYFKVVSSSVSCDIIFSGYIRELPLGDYRTLSLVPGYVEKKDLSKTIEYLNKTETPPGIAAIPGGVLLPFGVGVE